MFGLFLAGDDLPAMTGPIWAIAAGLHAAGTEFGQVMVVAAALHEPPTVIGPTGR